MLNFSELILEVMNEKGKTIKDLENNNILSKNTFYIFKDTAPSLNSIIKIANYLNTSIDYIIGNTTENNFKKYKINQFNFYNKLNKLLQSAKISQVKLCKDLEISRTNLSRWKNGTQPTLNKLISLATYLRCYIDELLEYEE
ncbi:MAG: helix-turn-helix transcriptional regulator [Clostridia bacterium]|nr:helix-turn-helix transcriptional regulator [Clostridia bacterium]